MDIFGQIGIDWRLVLAQAVNFAVLAWFLTKFVYKPLLKRMDSSELERAERAFAELSEQKEQLAKERQKVMNEAKEQAADRVREAERLAKDIDNRVSVEAAEKKKRLLEQAKQQFELERAALQGELEGKVIAKLALGLRESWRERLKDRSLRTSLNNHYLRRLIAGIDNLPSRGEAEGDMPPVVLKSATKLGAKERKEIFGALSKSLGEDVGVQDEVDDGLLAGYRLEAAGLAIDENLNRDIEYAAEN